VVVVEGDGWTGVDIANTQWLEFEEKEAERKKKEKKRK